MDVVFEYRLERAGEWCKAVSRDGQLLPMTGEIFLSAEGRST